MVPLSRLCQFGGCLSSRQKTRAAFMYIVQQLTDNEWGLLNAVLVFDVI